MLLLSNILTLVVLLVLGFALRAVGKKASIPPAASLMFLGVLVGTSGFDVIPQSYQAISQQLSLVAFVMLLLRAGLGMEPKAMGKMVPGIVLLGLIPAMAEMAFLATGARVFLFDRWDLALLAAFLVAAVSPAVILPTMLDQKHKGRGGPRMVPDRIMGMAIVNSFVAKASIILLLGLIVGTVKQSDLGRELLLLPLRLIFGVVLGFVLGRFVVVALEKVPRSETLIWGGAGLVLAASITMYFKAQAFYFEGVFAVLSFGLGMRLRGPDLADGFKDRFNSLWAVAEIPLFVNVGSLIDLGRLSQLPLVVGLLGLMILGLAVRKWAAWLCTARGDLSKPERFYVTLAQVPKATIQAVFGPVVFFTLGGAGSELREAGQLMLIMAVLAIISTAPIGAVVLDRWGGRLLPRNDESS